MAENSPYEGDYLLSNAYKKLKDNGTLTVRELSEYCDIDEYLAEAVLKRLESDKYAKLDAKTYNDLKRGEACYEFIPPEQHDSLVHNNDSVIEVEKKGHKKSSRNILKSIKKNNSLKEDFNSKKPLPVKKDLENSRRFFMSRLGEKFFLDYARKNINGFLKYFSGMSEMSKDKLAKAIVIGWFACVIPAGAFLLGRGKKIYEGEVGGQKFEYWENVGLFSKSNRMIVKRGELTYILIDNKKPSFLDLESDGGAVPQANLERIIVRENSKSYNLDTEKINDTNRILYIKASDYYDQTRNYIRKSVRDNQAMKFKRFADSLEFPK